MWLVKNDDDIDSPYGKSPGERTMEERIVNSVILVDKHAGPASQSITVWAKGIFGVKLAGHTGTLDPQVTGLLPIALQNAVKAMPAMMGLDKEYVGIMHIHKDLEEAVVRNAVLKFVGKITQTPPVRSAVARRPREREIYFFDILEIQGRDVLFKVGCQAGTYIRKLCSDIGVRLGTGAQMTELRRTRVGHFLEENSNSLLKIKDAYDSWKDGDEKELKRMLIPVEDAVSNVKKVFVKDYAAGNMAFGSPLYVSGATRIEKGIWKGDRVAMFSSKGELIALGISNMTSQEIFSLGRGAAVRTDRVFVARGSYPKSWSVEVQEH